MKSNVWGDIKSKEGTLAYLLETLEIALRKLERKPSKGRKPESTFKVEQLASSPEERNNFPWAEMKVGDSFFVDDSKGSTLRTCAYAWGKRHNQQMRVVKEKAGYRVWRIR